MALRLPWIKARRLSSRNEQSLEVGCHWRRNKMLGKPSSFCRILWAVLTEGTPLKALSSQDSQAAHGLRRRAGCPPAPSPSAGYLGWWGPGTSFWLWHYSPSQGIVFGPVPVLSTLRLSAPCDPCLLPSMTTFLAASQGQGGGEGPLRPSLRSQAGLLLWSWYQAWKWEVFLLCVLGTKARKEYLLRKTIHFFGANLSQIFYVRMNKEPFIWYKTTEKSMILGHITP